MAIKGIGHVTGLRRLLASSSLLCLVLPVLGSPLTPASLVGHTAAHPAESVMLQRLAVGAAPDAGLYAAG
jgi:hypothetical protein